MRALVLVALFLAGCSNLPAKDQLCGNGVIDRGEDCDNSNGSCDQCRLLCPMGSDIECSTAGSAYKCGADFVCHAPSGVFSAPTMRFVYSVQQGHVGDLDGDKIGDIIGFSDVSIDVRFGDLQASMTDRANAIVPFANSAIALRTLNNREDILLPTADGIAGFTASNKRLVSYPFSNGAGARGVCATLNDTAEPRESFSIDKHHLAFISRYKNDQGAKAGKLAVAIMDPNNTASCSTVDLCSTIAPQDPTKAVIYFDHYEVPKTQANEVISSVIAVASSLTPTDPTMKTQPGCVVRFTDDGAYKFSATQSYTVGKGPLALARATGTAQCPALYATHADASAGIDHYAETAPPCQVATTITDSVLASGQLPVGHVPLSPAPLGSSNTYEPDLLAVATSDGLGGTTALFRLAAGSLGSVVFQSTRPLLVLRSGDVDGDGVVDAIATVTQKGGGGSPDIDILFRTQVGTPNVSFVAYRITTQTTPQFLELGDFDGNGATDIAYIEKLPGQQRLMIAYGTHDRPLDPVQIATFTNVEAMSRIDVPDSIEPSGNALDDLLVVDVVPVDPNDPTKLLPLISILHGNPQRSMLGYYDPRLAGEVNRDYRTSQFVATVAGNFVDQDGRPDLLSIEFQPGPGPVTSDAAFVWASASAAATTGFAEGAPKMASANTIAVGQCPAAAELCLSETALAPWTLDDGRDVVIASDTPGFISMNPSRPRRLVTIDPLNAADPIQPSNTVTLPAMPPVVSMWSGDLDGSQEKKLVLSMPALPFVTQIDKTAESSVQICTVTAGVVSKCSSLTDLVTDLRGYDCGIAETGRISAGGRDIGGTLGVEGFLALCKSIGNPNNQAVFHVYPYRGDLVAKKVIPGVPSYSILSLGDLNGDFADDVVGISFDSMLQPIISIHLQCDSHDTKCIDESNALLEGSP